jgi:predicted transcriptional regulator
MSAPLIHRRSGFVPASKMVNVAGESLRAIKEADDLSWKDMGEALGKSEDQISKYALGTAEMPMTTVFRAMDVWNGRFANPVLSLFGLHISENVASKGSVQSGKVSLVELLLLLERALVDGEIDDAEIDAMAATVESAGAMIDQLRDRVAARREAKAELRIVKEG